MNDKTKLELIELTAATTTGLIVWVGAALLGAPDWAGFGFAAVVFNVIIWGDR